MTAKKSGLYNSRSRNCRFLKLGVADRTQKHPHLIRLTSNLKLPSRKSFYLNTEHAGLLFETQIQNLRGLIMQFGSGANLIQRNDTFETAHCSNIHK
jgi:hypothetical protein